MTDTFLTKKSNQCYIKQEEMNYLNEKKKELNISFFFKQEKERKKERNENKRNYKK